MLTATVGKNSIDRLASPTEIRAYRSIIGQCLYIGRLTNPVLQFHCSSLASKISALHTRHLKTLKTVVNVQLKNTSPITFQPSGHGGPFSLQALSDASMATSTDAARGGFIIFRRSGDVVHLLFWSARKLKRVARPSSTAELLAAPDATNTLAYLQHLLEELLYHHEANATFDSRALFDLSTTVHEPTEPLNKVDLSFIRQLYDPCRISSIFWTPGHYNVSDALTKNNQTSAALLSKVLKERNYPFHPDRITRTAEQPLEAPQHDSDQTGAC